MRLFGYRRLGHRVLHDLQRDLAVVADLHRRGVAAVDDLALATLGLQRACQHLYLQRDLAFLAGRHVVQRPDHSAVGVLAAVAG